MSVRVRLTCLISAALVAMLAVAPAIANDRPATALEHPQDDLPAAASTESESVEDTVLRVRMELAESRRRVEEVRAEGAARRAEAKLRHEQTMALRSNQRAHPSPRPPPESTLPDGLTLLAIAIVTPFLYFLARAMVFGAFALRLMVAGHTVQAHVIEHVKRFGLLRMARYEFWTPRGPRYGFLPSAWTVGETLLIIYDPDNPEVKRPRDWLGADMLNALTLGVAPALKLPLYLAIAIYRVLSESGKPRADGAI